MLLSSACLVAFLACASTISEATGNNVLTIDLHQHHKDGELTVESLQKHVAEIKEQAANGNGTVPMRNYQNVYYYTTIEVGTPGQKINVTIDTTSADFWFSSKKLCRQRRWKDFCSYHSTYDSKKSSTYKKTGKKFAIYNVIRGILSQDTVKVGNLSVPNQTFGEATSFSEDIIGKKPFEGEIGLAYPAASHIDIDPYFVYLVKQKIVDDAVFSMSLNNCSCACSCSELTLGGVNPKRYKGEIVYTDVIEKKYFNITIGGVKLASKPVIPQISAVLSTGTALMWGPKKYMEHINKAIGGKPYQGLYTVDCDKRSSLPNVTIVVEGTPLQMTAYEYILKFSDTCISTFVGIDIPYMVFGLPLSRSKYIVYDMAKNRVGFAETK